jgi:hypothetical protein
VALIALVGPRAAFGVTTAVFVLTAIVFRQVKEPEAAPRRDESMIAGIATGFAAVRSRPWMAVVLLFSTVELMFVLAPTQVLLPIVSRTVFHSDAVYGTGLTCYGSPSCCVSGGCGSSAPRSVPGPIRR